MPHTKDPCHLFLKYLVHSKSLHDKTKDTSDKKHSTRAEVTNKYYQLASLVSSNGCNVLKKMAGNWMKCGFLDGEKLLCMDTLYNAIHNDTCLVYSFGLADDWDFEIFMAKLGKFREYIQLLKIILGIFPFYNFFWKILHCSKDY